MPAPGPRSITQSAARMVSSSCSTTSTVLPRSRIPLRVAMQALVVALVEADRRLVEHVEDAHQLRADLGREADALALAARERRRRAVERQVADADVVEEAEAVADLLQDLGGDRALALGERQRREPGGAAPTTGMRRELVDRVPGDGDRQRLGPEPPALAVGAEADRHVLLDLARGPSASRFPCSAARASARRPRTCPPTCSSTSCP